jgi:chromosome segregation ATPase
MSAYPILLADSSSQDLEALESSISEAGHSLEKATSLEHVRSLLLEGSFGLVVLSGRDFFEAGTDSILEVIRSSDEFPELLLLAEEEDLEVATALVERGAGDYLARPFSANQLLSAIETSLVKYQVRRERAELESRLDDVRRRFNEASDRQEKLERTLDEGRERIVQDLERENQNLRQKMRHSIDEGTRDLRERLLILEERLADSDRESNRLHEECDRLTDQLSVEREDATKTLRSIQSEASEMRQALEESQRAQERLRSEKETTIRAIRDQADIDRRELVERTSNLEKIREDLQAQLEELASELQEARESRRATEEDTRKLREELREELRITTETLESRDQEYRDLKNRHDDLLKLHKDGGESSHSRIMELEAELRLVREEGRRVRDNADKVRIRLERHLETKDSEIRSMAEERSVLRSRIKTLDDDLHALSREMITKDEEREGLIQELEARARRAERQARELETSRDRRNKRHKEELESLDRKLQDRDREARRLGKENTRLSEYLRSERAELGNRLEASETQIQSLLAAKNALSEELGKRLEDQTGRLERLSRDHDRIAGDHRGMVERLENEVRSLRDALVDRETANEANNLTIQEQERRLQEKDRLIGELTLELRDAKADLGYREEIGGPQKLTPAPSDASEELLEEAPAPRVRIEEDPFDASEEDLAKNAKMDKVKPTVEELNALLGGWGELSAEEEEALPDRPEDFPSEPKSPPELQAPPPLPERDPAPPPPGFGPATYQIESQRPESPAPGTTENPGQASPSEGE